MQSRYQYVHQKLQDVGDMQQGLPTTDVKRQPSNAQLESDPNCD